MTLLIPIIASMTGYGAVCVIKIKTRNIHEYGNVIENFAGWFFAAYLMTGIWLFSMILMIKPLFELKWLNK